MQKETADDDKELRVFKAGGDKTGTKQQFLGRKWNDVGKSLCINQQLL